MNIAIVGCGAIAAVHAESIFSMKGYRLSAFADIDYKKAADFANRYHGKAYNTYEEMIQNEQIDVLHICTPHYLHVPMAIYALEHGLHVFAEKPPVISYEQLAQLEDLDQLLPGKKLGFCFQNRYNPSVILVKKLLESGDTGAILGGRGIVTWNRSEEYYTESSWRGKLVTEGGGALINQSIHTLDLLTCLLGSPVSIESHTANYHLKDIIEVEDTMEAFIRFENNRTASFYATTAYPVNPPPLIEIICENMTIRIEELDVTYYYKDGRIEKPQIESKAGLGKSYWGCGHQDCIEDFYQSILSGRPFAQDLNGVKNTIHLLLCAYESARTGREIRIPKEVH